MSPVIQFYQKIIQLLALSDSLGDDAVKLITETSAALRRCGKNAVSLEFDQYWLIKMAKIRDIPERIGMEHPWDEPARRIAITAFKDLCIIKGTPARQTFSRLQDILGFERFLFVWIEEKSLQSGGSGVFKTYTTCYATYLKCLYDGGIYNDPEEGTCFVPAWKGGSRFPDRPEQR